ncbi:hypothetical protein, partial [Streptosporangium lutulentum]|uniref:hypothetical protein n=1 Tax=Streptosporangium lutulentum TaxID=1461250 RepID=UPI0036428E96
MSRPEAAILRRQVVSPARIGPSGLFRPHRYGRRPSGFGSIGSDAGRAPPIGHRTPGLSGEGRAS